MLNLENIFMLDLFLQQDKALFLFINHLPHNFLFDTFFGFMTLIGYLGAVWVTISIYLYTRNKPKFKRLLKTIIIADLISLVLVEWLLKNIVARPRPLVDIPTAIVPFDFYHSFSFPSGHAVMSFAAAFILAHEYKKLKWFFWSLAFLISFSRIYLGKHYPSDVIVGGIIGVLIGIISLKFDSLKKATAGR